MYVFHTHSNNEIPTQIVCVWNCNWRPCLRIVSAPPTTTIPTLAREYHHHHQHHIYTVRILNIWRHTHVHKYTMVQVLTKWPNHVVIKLFNDKHTHTHRQSKSPSVYINVGLFFVSVCLHYISIYVCTPTKLNQTLLLIDVAGIWHYIHARLDGVCTPEDEFAHTYAHMISGAKTTIPPHTHTHTRTMVKYFLNLVTNTHAQNTYMRALCQQQKRANLFCF